MDFALPFTALLATASRQFRANDRPVTSAVLVYELEHHKILFFGPFAHRFAFFLELLIRMQVQVRVARTRLTLHVNARLLK